MSAPPLACTVRECGLLLERRGRTWQCARRHSYDVARSGYVNLLQPQDRKSLNAGDTAGAVEARARLIASGIVRSILSGVVDSLGQGMHASTVLLGLDAPAPGTAYIGAFNCGGMVMVCLSVYLYGASAKAAVERDQPAWQSWMGRRFPMPPSG